MFCCCCQEPAHLQVPDYRAEENIVVSETDQKSYQKATETIVITNRARTPIRTYQTVAQPAQTDLNAKAYQKATATIAKTNQARTTISTYQTVAQSAQTDSNATDKKNMLAFAKKGRECLDNRQAVQATTFFKQALNLTVKVYGPEHPEVKYSQKMGGGMMNQMAGNDNPMMALFTALTLAAVLSNFVELKPVIGDVDQFSAGLLGSQ